MFFLDNQTMAQIKGIVTIFLLYAMKRVVLLKRAEMIKLIQSLSTDEASQVFKDMLNNDPMLLKQAYETALKIVKDVDVDDIMNDVFYSLESFDVDDLSSRSGRTRYGYTDPNDASWEMFEEELDPFIDEMKKNQERGLPKVAKIYCIGIVKGLLLYDSESKSDFYDWVQDAPGEYIDRVIDEWKKGKPDDNDVAEVMSIARGE